LLKQNPKGAPLAGAIKDDYKIHEAIRDRQKPGMGANDLTASVTAVHRIRQRVHQVREWVGLVHAGDTATLLQKLSEAEA